MPLRAAVLPALRHLGVAQLDLVVASHADLDHRGGLEAVLEGLPAGELWLPRGAAPLLALSILASLAVMSPFVDPWRLSARSQADRLISGRADAEPFDYGYLRFSLGLHGRAELDRLAESDFVKNNEVVAQRLNA